MNNGWLELESDPGLFTLLLQDFGVKGVQVEEIYDLQKPIEGPAYGFIFLFRWIEQRKSRRKTITEEETFVTDENIVNSIFFAQQMIPNSCATHALLSVLLNCEKVSLGETISQLKDYCKHMNPENKGYAIGNMPELARAHNSHARRELSHLPEKQQGMTVRTMEAFHFVSFVPIHGRLFELDGLKPYPIDHGPWDSTEDWTEKFRRVISERLGMATGGEPYHDIRYNLMAVVPDKVSLFEHKLSTLKTNRQIVLEALQQMVRLVEPSITASEKEKCIAAVKKRGESIDIDPSPIAVSKTESVSCQTSISPQSTRTVPSIVIHRGVQSMGSVEQMTIIVDSRNEVIKTEPMEVESIVDVISECDDSIIKTEIKGEAGDASFGANVLMSEDKKTSVLCPAASASRSTDLTQPLTIETKFSASPGPGPSSESTDTASEVGSCFSSPSSSIVSTSAQNSPNFPDGVKTDGETAVKPKTKLHSQQGFRPKDLIALLKNVEKEIKLCETKLQDEQEKINKYKIDDCRRTHNYDPFLCTFLSMLAEQGHLADLVQQHSFIKKRVPGHIGKLSKLTQAAAKRKRTKVKRRR